MDKEIFTEERKRLEEVIKIINNKIKIAEENLKKQEHFIIGFKEGLRGTQFNRQALMSLYGTEIYNLNSVVNNPYFGRFEFQDHETGEKSLIYLGKRAITDENNNMLSYDWRSPICSVYYDYNIGPAEYTYNNKKYTGDILSKRQIIIKDGKLTNVSAEDALSDDAILIQYLNEFASARLKSIVATIQKEQNKIIRGPLKSDNLVEGVAGSGKTTVALHRIAYLLYNEAKNINESEFLILGPNKYFLDYISALLPELDIKNVEQTTFEDIVLKFLGKVNLISRNQTLQNIFNGQEDPLIIEYKNSFEYLNLLDKYINMYFYNHLNADITYEGIVLCDKQKLQSLYTRLVKSNRSYNDNVKDFIKILVKDIKERSDDLSHDLWVKDRDEFKKLDKNSKRRQEILDYHNQITLELKKGCPQIIKKFFEFTNIKPLNFYQTFITCLSKLDNNPLLKEVEQQTLTYLKNKQVKFDDLVLLLYINYKFNGMDEYKKYAHLIIDEGQDLSLLQYYVLKMIFNNANFDVFGDTHQAIYDYESIRDWDTLNSAVFSGKANLLELNKSYRITENISSVANSVLEYLDYQKEECIARCGSEININDVTNKDNILTIIKEIKDMLDKGLKSIAIICKDDNETKNLYNKLKKYNLNISLITEKNKEYQSALCIMPSYFAKGLEFDGVILANANDINYGSNVIDMKLLYVAITRAMHELYINYDGELTLCLKNYLNKDNQRKLKKED